MTTEKASLMFIVFTLIQLVCVISVILCENNTIDWCIIGFQVLMILVQILITVFDIRKTIKTNK
jgi:isoprenylcysteine carboxyl methyltransferase (ICMT) family protein YpbQ